MTDHIPPAIRDYVARLNRKLADERQADLDAIADTFGLSPQQIPGYALVHELRAAANTHERKAALSRANPQDNAP
jgi:hypothetical protein